MKKELSISMTASIKVRQFIQEAGTGLANIYSNLLEEKISVSQAWRILHASIAFSFTAFTACSVLMHFILAIWFLFTLWDCKRVGLK